MKTNIYDNKLIYGKDNTEGLVSLEVKNDEVYAYFNDGSLKKQPAIYFITASRAIDSKFKRLDGETFYKYVRVFKTKKEYLDVRKRYWRYKDVTWSLANDVEAHMLTRGSTLFKGLDVDQVSRLGFDIETDGLVKHKASTIFMISNTFRDGKGNESKKVFVREDYMNVGEMITEWCNYVRDLDPTLMIGHNVIGYDFPYMCHVAKLNNVPVTLGRDCSNVNISTRSKNYRVDGSQTWEYKDVNVFGRHVIDTMFLSVKYDIGRNFPSWGLKPIIEHLGLVKEGRQFYDASKIKDNWNNDEERRKIIEYGIDDGDDALNLYELMIPSFFYLSQNIPKPFQLIVNSASGSWLNFIMLRSYLQDFKSIPKPNERDQLHGGISFGIAGVYSNVLKIDVKSFYPSIIRTNKLYSRDKDPDGVYLELTNYFTEKRFEQKNMYKKTGEKKYDDLQASSKIFINSLFGLAGTSGAHFNDFELANTITRVARITIKETIVWATNKTINHWWKDYDENKDIV